MVAALLAVVALSFARSSTNNANLAATRAAEALANERLAAVSEREAINSANLALTREAEAEQEREAVVSAQATTQVEARSRATAEANAVQQQNVAQEQTALAISRELSPVANNLLETDPELSILLAMEAIKSAYTKEADEALHNALQRSRALLTISDETVDFGGAIHTPDGTGIVVHASDDTLHLRDATAGDFISSVPISGLIYWQQFTGNGDELLIVTSLGDYDGASYPGFRVSSWDIGTTIVTEVRRLKRPFTPS